MKTFLSMEAAQQRKNCIGKYAVVTFYNDRRVYLFDTKEECDEYMALHKKFIHTIAPVYST